MPVDNNTNTSSGLSKEMLILLSHWEQKHSYLLQLTIKKLSAACIILMKLM